MFKNLFTTTSALWALRMLLQFGGFWLVTNGHATADDIARATGVIEELVQPAGGLAFLIGLAANVYASFRTKIVAAGQAVGPKEIAQRVGPGSATEVVQVGKAAIERKPTLWEQWFGRR